MCKTQCGGVTVFKGEDGAVGPAGVGIASTVDNGDGTFTITYTDATTFTTSDLTGPQGPAGTIPGGGDLNYVAKWTPNGSELGNSQIEDNGSLIGVNNPLQSNYRFVVGSSTDTYTLTGNNTNTSGGAGVFGIASGVTTNTNIGGISNASNSTSLNIGHKGDATQSTIGTNIGGWFRALNGANNYALKLDDGSQGLGKVLTDVTGNGDGQWQTPASSGGKTWYTITGTNPAATVMQPNSGYVIRDTNGAGTTDLTLPSSGVNVGDEIKIIATKEGNITNILQTWRILEGNAQDVIFSDAWSEFSANNRHDVKSTSPLWTFDDTPGSGYANQKACTLVLTCIQDLSPGYAWSIEFSNNART